MVRATRTTLRPTRSSSSISCSIGTILKTIMVAILMSASYFLGASTILMHHDISTGQSNNNSAGCINADDVDALVREKVAKELKTQREIIEKTKVVDPAIEMKSSSTGHADEARESLPRFPSTMSGYLAGQVRVSRTEYLDKFDYGTAHDHNMKSSGKQEVFILYHSDRALPLDKESFGHKAAKYQMDEFPVIDVDDATKNCNELNTVVIDAGGGNGLQCTAIIPGFPSWHLQRWSRSDERGKLNASLPLRHVGRGLQTNGMDKFGAPSINQTKESWNSLKTFFDSVDDVLAELRPILEKIARKNTIIVMVCNFGQSSLLMNFVCNAKSKGIDISSAIVFATDEQTYKLAKGLGLAAIYDEKNFGDLPVKEARAYGDRTFTKMMWAKVVVVQLVSWCGYDLLFQDVDVVWYKDPLEIFHDDKSPYSKFDVLFQDDGARSLRYAPYSANSGFYFARQNSRTRHLFTSLLYSGDFIAKTGSHQQALTALLAEHSSLTGLTVKTLNTHDFPGGWNYHRKGNPTLREMMTNKHVPVIFHMCWTKNKDDKLRYLKQIGQWHVHEKCEKNNVVDMVDRSGEEPISTSCCAADPIITCFYRDKPSIVPCKDSPPIDKGAKSWW